jgi:hypothetical protein
MRFWVVFCLILAALPAAAEKYHLNPTQLVPAATGDINVDRDDNGNTKLDVKVDHLARPGSLAPARMIYVVWVQGPGGAAENIGELKVGDDLKAELKTVTPLRNFELFITGENDGQVTQPQGPVVMRSTIHQSGD